jgi:cobalt-zinc-cadmium efflux system protein
MRLTAQTSALKFEKDMSHNHSDGIGNYNRAFAIGIILNILFVAVEAGYGIFADSLALVADAGHNLSDVVSLLLAWGASVLATKAATEKRTYGFRKATVMASLASAILLLVALGGIAWESIGRFFNPKPVEGLTVIVVAAIGVVINTLTALLFVKGQKRDLNIRGAFLHMAADAGVSLGVVVAGIFIIVKGWLWIDPVVSLMIVAAILVGTWGLLRDSINAAMDAVPDSIDIPAIRNYLMSFDYVDRIHDLHVWPLSTTEIALTVHIVVNDDSLDNNFLRNIQQHLHDHFGIEHATIQVEASMGENDCMLDSQNCV